MLSLKIRNLKCNRIRYTWEEITIIRLKYKKLNIRLHISKKNFFINNIFFVQFEYNLLLSFIEISLDGAT